MTCPERELGSESDEQAEKVTGRVKVRVVKVICSVKVMYPDPVFYASCSR